MIFWRILCIFVGLLDGYVSSKNVYNDSATITTSTPKTSEKEVLQHSLVLSTAASFFPSTPPLLITPPTKQNLTVVDDGSEKNATRRSQRKKNRRPKQQASKQKIYTSTLPPQHQNDGPGDVVLDFVDTTWKNVPIPKAKESIHENKFDINLKQPLHYLINPDWTTCKKTWKLWWEVHMYGVGILFAFLDLYLFVSILRLICTTHLLDTGYCICISLILFIMSSTRVLVIALNGYNAREMLPKVVARIFLDSGQPCLISAFLLLFVALIHTTKTSFMSPKLHHASFILVLIIFNISLTVCVDVFVDIFNTTELLVVIMHSITYLWSTLVAFLYVVAFPRLLRNAQKKHSEMIRATFTKLHIDGAEMPRKLPSPTIGLAVKTTLFCAFLLTCLSALHIYGLIEVYKVFHNPSRPDPWPWWSYQLVGRCLEFTLSAAIAFTATQPLRHNDPVASNVRWCNPVPYCCGCCCRKHRRDVIDNESCSDFTYGFRNENFNTSLDFARPWIQEVSTFQSPASLRSPVEPVLPTPPKPIRTSILTNTLQALSSLSSRHSKFLGSLKDTHSAQASENGSRPSSILFRDRGFKKVRKDDEIIDSVNAECQKSDDEDASADEKDSLRANAGSNAPTLCDEDLFQSSLSPFFRGCYAHRFKRTSRCSLETTDQSMDLSSDHLSSVTASRAGSNLDFNNRRIYGSTCSSESAAHSFDIAFFLKSSGNSKQEQHAEFLKNIARLQNEKRDCPNTDLPAGRSISPLVCASRSHQGAKMSLNLSCSPGVIHASCGTTEDITPDSAVYLDLHISPHEETMPPACTGSVPLLLDDYESSPRRTFSRRSSRRSTWSREFLDKIKSASSSISLHPGPGYEPLNQATEECSTYFGGASLGKMSCKRRSTSCDRRPISAQDSRENDKRNYIEQLCHGDSGMQLECSTQKKINGIDEACQTDFTSSAHKIQEDDTSETRLLRDTTAC